MTEGPHVATAVYADGVRVATPPLEACGTWASKPGHFVWIAFHEPGEADIRQLQHLFNLHELAVEDALEKHHRPKLAVHGDALFMVMRTAQRTGGRLHFGQTHIFAGCNYIVTLRRGPSNSYAPVRRRAESTPEMLREGVDFALHAMMDHIVDAYFPVVDSFEADVVAVEERVLGRRFRPREVDRIHALRRDLQRLKRSLTPLLDVTSRLQRFELPMIDDVMRPYFRDLHDHVVRLTEDIDDLRETLSFAFDASMMISSAQQTVITKKLAGWGAILAVPTGIAGIYGMNFDNMPELHWQYGYFTVLGVTTAVCGFLYYRFKRSGWL